MTLFFCLLPTFTCAFWCAALLIAYFEHRQKDKLMLAVFMLVATMLYVGHSIYFNHIMGLLPVADTIYCMANLAVFPLYYLYICQVTGQRPRSWLLPLLPSVLGGIAVGVCYMAMTDVETGSFVSNYLYYVKLDGLHGLAYAQAKVHQVLRLMFILMLPIIVYLSWKKATAYNHQLRDFYADCDDKVFVIPRHLSILFILTVVLSIGCGFIGRLFFYHSLILLALPSIAFSSLLFIFGYKGFTRQFTITDYNHRLEITSIRGLAQQPAERQSDGEREQEADGSEENTAGNLPGANFAELGRRISQLMTEQRVFLNHNLTINDLAAMLGTNREYIYRAMKEQDGRSFSEVVNRLRVEYAAARLQDDPGMSAYLLADEAGFSSVTSFYRNFKLYMGCTPRQWLQRDGNI